MDSWWFGERSTVSPGDGSVAQYVESARGDIIDTTASCFCSTKWQQLSVVGFSTVVVVPPSLSAELSPHTSHHGCNPYPHTIVSGSSGPFELFGDLSATKTETPPNDLVGAIRDMLARKLVVLENRPLHLATLRIAEVSVQKNLILPPNPVFIVQAEVRFHLDVVAISVSCYA